MYKIRIELGVDIVISTCDARWSLFSVWLDIMHLVMYFWTILKSRSASQCYPLTFMERTECSMLAGNWPGLRSSSIFLVGSLPISTDLLDSNPRQRLKRLETFLCLWHHSCSTGIKHCLLVINSNILYVINTMYYRLKRVKFRTEQSFHLKNGMAANHFTSIRYFHR